MSSLNELLKLKQSPWLDAIDRKLISSGELQKLVDDGLRGLTSNPAIFEKAIGGQDLYDPFIEKILKKEDLDPKNLFEKIAIQDIRDAADILKPVYDKCHGQDGFVSLEVSPYLARDTKGSIEEGVRLWKEVSRQNLMIKIPGTVEGIPAIEELIALGINVNVTLLFSQERYLEVAQSYIRGLQRRIKQNLDIKSISSVASFFVSRIDVAVDKELPPKSPLLGRVAIANAKMAYQKYLSLIESPEWSNLSVSGANPQRLLWASTSTKNPVYRDVLYIEELIGPDTVNTIPPATMKAFQDHGNVRPSLCEGLNEAQTDLNDLEKAGISLEKITRKLTEEAIVLFSDPFDKLMGILEKKRQTFIEKTQGVAMNQMETSYSTSQTQSLEVLFTEWKTSHKLAQLWNHDSSLWTGKDEDKWLGWLSIVEEQQRQITELDPLKEEFQKYKSVVLLGMGGSSLCPEILAKTFGVKPHHPEFLVLDSTDPDQVGHLNAKLELEKTCFIVSSKSGSTLEPNIFLDYFYRPKLAKHFIAITDPGSALEKKALELQFGHIFYGKPSIGGRYSALSYFGMVPAVALGIDVKKFLDRALEMVHSCGPHLNSLENPGFKLGLALGALALNGQDKISLFASPSLKSFPDWIEQLVAESTGKNNKGLIPVVENVLMAPAEYGHDRHFIYLKLKADKEDLQIEKIKTAGMPVTTIVVNDVYSLGQEFFRWEIAVAIAGAILKINPFDQPDVEAAKIATRKLTSEFEKTGILPVEKPLFENEDFQVFGAEIQEPSKNLEDYLQIYFNQIKQNDYVGILAYIEMNSENEELLQKLKDKIQRKTKSAVCIGFGPRFLHSTGQLYKGGPNTGVFLQLSTNHKKDLTIPNHKFTFGIVETAQARGDYEVLKERKRRIIHVHIKSDFQQGLNRLSDLYK